MHEYIYGPPPPPPSLQSRSSSSSTSSLPLPSVKNYGASDAALQRPRPTPYSRPGAPIYGSNHQSSLLKRPSPAAYSAIGTRKDPRKPATSGAMTAAPNNAKSNRQDGDISIVSQDVLKAASDVESWIAQRRKNWPTAERIAEKERQELLNAKPAPPPSDDINSESTKSTNNTAWRRPCKYFAQGNCINGANCSFSHNITYKRFEAPAKDASLFKRLVQKDMDAENNAVLDFILYLSEKGVLEK